VRVVVRRGFPEKAFYGKRQPEFRGEKFVLRRSSIENEAAEVASDHVTHDWSCAPPKFAAARPYA